eukprot:3940541-Rhodomonas_salina.6
MSGTEIAYAAMQACCATASSVIAYDGVCLRACCVMPGTAIAYAAMRCPVLPQRRLSAYLLRHARAWGVCCAVLGTDVAYGHRLEASEEGGRKGREKLVAPHALCGTDLAYSATVFAMICPVAYGAEVSECERVREELLTAVKDKDNALEMLRVPSYARAMPCPVRRYVGVVLSSYVLAMPCPVLTQLWCCVCYCDVRWCYAFCGTELAYGAMRCA